MPSTESRSADKKAALILAEQLSVQLDMAFSEPTQPWTLTSDPRVSESDTYFTIFAAIATTSCDAFASVNTGTEGVPLKRSRSSTTDPPELNGADQWSNGHGGHEEPSRSRARFSSEPGRSRSRLSFTPDPKRPAVVVNSVSTSSSQLQNAEAGPSRNSQALFLPAGSQTEEEHPSTSQILREALDGAGSQRYVLGEVPVSPPTPSQRVHMSQQEVLEQAGMGDVDIHHLIDDLDDLEEEEEKQAEKEELNADVEQFEAMQEEMARAPQSTQHVTTQGQLEVDTSIFPPADATTEVTARDGGREGEEIDELDEDDPGLGATQPGHSVSCSYNPKESLTRTVREVGSRR